MPAAVPRPGEAFRGRRGEEGAGAGLAGSVLERGFGALLEVRGHSPGLESRVGGEARQGPRELPRPEELGDPLRRFRPLPGHVREAGLRAFDARLAT